MSFLSIELFYVRRLNEPPSLGGLSCYRVSRKTLYVFSFAISRLIIHQGIRSLTFFNSPFHQLLKTVKKFFLSNIWASYEGKQRHKIKKKIKFIKNSRITFNANLSQFSSFLWCTIFTTVQSFLTLFH